MSLAGTAVDPRTQIAALRKRFKAQCEATSHKHQNWQIRVHRALSWLDRACELDAADHPDGRVLYAWIAFNSLYGSWDPEKGVGARDGESWRAFIARVLAMDTRGRLAQRLVDLKRQVLAVLKNRYLDPEFWGRQQRTADERRTELTTQTLYYEKRWQDLLEKAIGRIYVLRGQIVHGAATRGSRLNRGNLENCRLLLEGLLLPALEIVIEQGANDNWPPICYPPVDDPPSPPQRTQYRPR